MTDTVLLIQPPIRDFYFTRKRSIPYGLISIAASLEREGFTVRLIDGLATSKSRVIDWPDEMAYLDPYYGRADVTPFSLFHNYRHFGYSIEHIGNLAAKTRAFLVGISSLFTAYADQALSVAREIRKQLPEAKIVLGGHHPTRLYKAVMQEPTIDFVIRGEGEAVMGHLARALQNGWPTRGIKGLVQRDCEGRTISGDMALMDDPDAWPLPAMDLVNHAFYGRKKGGSYVITASRGCPMNCTYCCVASKDLPFRKRSVDRIFEEITMAVEQFGARFIDFEDENLTLDKSWCLELLTRISERFGHLGIELRAMNGLFPPSLDEELIRAMKKAGFSALNLSVCTLNRAQLERFRRVDVRLSLEHVLDWAAMLELDTVCYILAGAPGQAAMDSVDDLIYLSGKNSLVGVSVFYPAPGSRDFETISRQKALPGEFSLMRSSVIPITGSTTRIQAVTLLRLGRILNFVKELKKTGRKVFPSQFTNSCFDSLTDRFSAGHALVNAFYRDGCIRGMDGDGQVYEHISDRDLCRAFIRGTSAWACDEKDYISRPSGHLESDFGS